MVTFRKMLATGVVAAILVGGLVTTSTPASALWLVRGMPLHVGTIHYRRHAYGYHYGYRHVYRRFSGRLYGRNLRSGFFPSCAGTYGVPIC